MSLLKRHLLRGLCACAALALACCRTPAEDSGANYRAWLAERAHAAETGTEPRDAALAAALRQHLCGADAACFPDSAWHALDMRARQSDDPGVLSLATSVAAHRDQTDIASRWGQVGALDKDNASPLLMQAAAEWKNGRHAEALELLRSALRRPHFDEGYTETFKLILPIVAARSPAPEEMHPCATALDEPADAPSDEVERRLGATVEIVVDFAPQLDFFILCKEHDDTLASTQRELCEATGTLIVQQATTQMGRLLGLAMQRLVNPDPAEQQALWARQMDFRDQFQRRLWWLEVDPNGKRRAAAAAFWIDQLLRQGELASSRALIQHFGEPPAESAEDRDSRFRARMQQGQQCYARYNARYHHDPK